MKNADVIELKDAIKKFNSAQPGSVSRMKTLLEISHFKVADSDVPAMAEVMMQVRYGNNEVDHEIILEGLMASKMRGENEDDSLELELEAKYGENPWCATNSILSKNSKLRDLLKKRSAEEHKGIWFDSFMEYES